MAATLVGREFQLDVLLLAIFLASGDDDVRNAEVRALSRVFVGRDGVYLDSSECWRPAAVLLLVESSMLVKRQRVGASAVKVLLDVVVLITTRGGRGPLIVAGGIGGTRVVILNRGVSVYMVACGLTSASNNLICGGW